MGMEEVAAAAHQRCPGKGTCSPAPALFAPPTARYGDACRQKKVIHICTELFYAKSKALRPCFERRN